CRALTLGRRGVSPADIAKDRRWLKILGSVGVPLAVLFHGGVGALFGVIGARPYWSGGLTPITFLVGALVSGGALLAFVTAFWGPDRGSPEHRNLVAFLGQILLGLLAFDLLLEWAEYSTGLYSAVPSEAEALRIVLFGQFWWVFWVVHLVVGAVIPLSLLAFRGRSVGSVATAGALIATTFLAVRLNIVVPGLAVEEMRGLSEAFSGPGLTFEYFPSSMEWLFFVWVASAAGLLFLAGYSLLPIVGSTEVPS
ncbi:MAG: NrfD/PsrC family molybdoenzyme membrane anchor subunit, partial [Anaerolineae bacterium]